ncbi:hypothetical protein LINGRAHAP2_LOCUS7055, partial [Linum grandiflorum]
PVDVVWPKIFPPKVQVFCWKVFHKRIATTDNLQKRGISMANWCVLCGNNSKSVNHIMLKCTFTTSIWTRIRSSLSIFEPLSGDTRDFIVSWQGMNCHPYFRVVLKGIMHATFWFTWLERNDRIFKDKHKSCNQIFNRIMLNVSRWVFAADLFTSAQLIVECFHFFTLVDWFKELHGGQ